MSQPKDSGRFQEQGSKACLAQSMRAGCRGCKQSVVAWSTWMTSFATIHAMRRCACTCMMEPSSHPLNCRCRQHMCATNQPPQCKLLLHRALCACCVALLRPRSKYEEVHAKESEHYCCALLINTYTKQQLVAMESHILAALDYRLALPTPWTLLHHFLQASGAACNSHPGTHKQLGSLASYMLELSLLCHDMMAVRPSLRAAASMYLALKMLGCRESWGQQLAQLSRYTQQQVEEQAVALAFMHACNERDGGFTASRDSYAAGSRLHVASIAPCLELAVQHDQAVQWWVEGAARLMPWTGTLQPLQQTSDPIQAAAARWEWTAQYTPWGSMPHTPGQQQQQQDWMTQGARSDGTAHTHGQLQQWAAQCNAPCSSTDSGSVLSAEQPAGCTWLYMPGPAALPAPGPSDSGWMAGSSPPSGVLSAAWQTPNNDSQAVGQSDWRCAQSSWGGTLCASSQPHWGWAAASAGLPWTVGWSAGHPWTGWQLFESAPAAPSTGRHSSFTGFVCTAG